MRASRSEIEDAERYDQWVTLLVSGLGILRWIVGTGIVYHFAVKYW